MSRVLRFGAAVWLTGSLLGCSGGDESPPPAAVASAVAKASPADDAPLPKPCTLLSAAEASAVLGDEAGLMVDDPENCTYTASAGVGQISFLMLSVQRLENEAEAVEIYNALAGMNPQLGKLVNDMAGEKTKKKGESIDGLGEEALLTGGNFDLIGTRTLTVRQGRLVIHYNITAAVSPAKPKDGLAQREALLNAARALVAKL